MRSKRVEDTRQRLVQVAENGRMNLPADVRRALGLKGAGRIILTQDENGVLLTTADQALRRVRALAAPFKPDGRSVVDDLLDDRREDMVRDDGQDPDVSRG
jgi:AbrB family looped-hinge helix DNA binding protein